MATFNQRPQSSAAPIKFELRRVPINNGGYDSSGAYWGVGAPLYWYCGDGREGYMRAGSRVDAREALLGEYPNARFYR